MSKTQAAGGNQACSLSSNECRAYSEKCCEEGLDKRREECREGKRPFCLRESARLKDG